MELRKWEAFLAHSLLEDSDKQGETGHCWASDSQALEGIIRSGRRWLSLGLTSEGSWRSLGGLRIHLHASMQKPCARGSGPEAATVPEV